MLTGSSKQFSHELTSTQKQQIYMTQNIVLKKMKTVQFNLPTLLENYAIKETIRECDWS